MLHDVLNDIMEMIDNGVKICAEQKTDYDKINFVVQLLASIYGVCQGAKSMDKKEVK